MIADYALGLGSNLGNGRDNLLRAIDLMRSCGIRTCARSTLYGSAPWGIVEQPPFTNACVLVESALSPTQMLVRIKALERQMGRKRGPRWGPRLIDIDLLIAKRGPVKGPRLVMPHPGILERAFVIVPLSELLPRLYLKGWPLAIWAKNAERDGLTPIEWNVRAGP